MRGAISPAHMAESSGYPVRVGFGEDAAGRLHPIRTDSAGRTVLADDDSEALTTEERSLAILEELLLESKKTNELLLEVLGKF